MKISIYDKQLAETLLKDMPKLFELAQKNPDLYDEYANKIYRWAEAGYNNVEQPDKK